MQFVTAGCLSRWSPRQRGTGTLLRTGWAAQFLVQRSGVGWDAEVTSFCRVSPLRQAVFMFLFPWRPAGKALQSAPRMRICRWPEFPEFHPPQERRRKKMCASISEKRCVVRNQSQPRPFLACGMRGQFVASALGIVQSCHVRRATHPCQCVYDARAGANGRMAGYLFLGGCS